MTETLARGYSSESTQTELSNEYQHIANAVDHWGVWVSPRMDESYEGSTLTLLVAKLPIQNDAKYPKKYEPLANGYSSENAQQEPSNECQHDRV